MALATYSDLKSAVTTWAFRDGDTDFIARVPDFIKLAEERFNNSLNVRQMETTVTLTPDSNGDCTLPSDYQGFRSVKTAYSGYNIDLELISQDMASKLFPNDSITDGPKYFTLVGSKIHVVPTYTGNVVLTYWAAIPALSDSNTTNWLLTQAPSVYLYGTLLESAPFMMDDQRAMVWGKMLETAIDNLNASDRDQRFSRLVSRVRGATP
jgi:hypothetical protein